MPNPLLPFDPTKPGDTDFRNVFPALDRSDKASLAAVLGTLAPSGTVTTAWRVQQVGNAVWLTQNASYRTPGQWVLDDVSLSASGIVYNLASNQIGLLWSPSGTSPFSNFQLLAAFQATPNAVNNLLFWDSVSGSAPVIQAYGSDPNIGLNLSTKGTGTLQLNGQPLAQTSNTAPGYLRLGPVTIQWGSTSVTVATANTWASATVTFPVAFSLPPFAITALLAAVTASQAAAYGSATTTTFTAYAVSATTGALQYVWMAVGAT